MKFTKPGQATDFKLAHPKLQKVLLALDDYTRAKGWPELTVTCMDRTAEENAAIYPTQPGKFSWHLVSGCAADIRTKHYTADQLDDIVRRIPILCQRGEFEFLYKPHGTGPHIHLAFRDKERRRQFESTATKGVA